MLNSTVNSVLQLIRTVCLYSDGDELSVVICSMDGNSQKFGNYECQNTQLYNSVIVYSNINHAIMFFAV